MEEGHLTSVFKAMLRRFNHEDPLTILREFQMGAESGTYCQELIDVFEVLENTLLMMIEDGMDVRESEQEVGSIALAILGFYDASKSGHPEFSAITKEIDRPEKTAQLTAGQDKIAKQLLQCLDEPR